MTPAFSTFALPSGGFMRLARASSQAAKALAIIAPGRGEWIEKYAQTIARLQACGLDVLIFEWRGQGLSARFGDDPQKACVHDFTLLEEDFDAFYKAHALTEKPVVLIGHSMGAHLLLRWRTHKGAEHASAGLILSNILVEPNTAPFPLPLARQILVWAMQRKQGDALAPTQKNFDAASVPFAGNRLTRDARRYAAMMQQLKDNPALKPGGATYGCIAAMFAAAPLLLEGLHRNPPREPVLLLTSSRDRIVTVGGMHKVAALLPHATKITFAGAEHELFQETDAVQEKLWAAIDAFLEKIL